MDILVNMETPVKDAGLEDLYMAEFDRFAVTRIRGMGVKCMKAQVWNNFLKKWMVVTWDEMENIDEKVYVDGLKKLNGESSPLPAGHREKVLPVSQSICLPSRLIPTRFRENTDVGNCVWRAIAILVHKTDRTTANHMVEMLHNDRYLTWNFMFKGEFCVNNQLMKNTCYHLRKIKTPPPKQGEKNGETLMKKVLELREMIVVVTLEDLQGQCNHTVGIDFISVPFLIWDSKENSALTLFQEHLNRCCGNSTVCVGFKEAGIIERKRKQKNKKLKTIA
jgi:hypothetical protein